MELKKIIFISALFLISSLWGTSQEVIKIGIIGLDTSHSPAFIKLLNSKSPLPEHQGFKVVAAYPYGSTRIESSAKRIPEYTRTAEEYGVEIVESIPELIDKVDCVMLETNDGNMHLEQAAEVMKAGKPMFIDKPIGATLADAIAIYSLADKYNALIFSSSALRYVPKNQDLRKGVYGKVLGADCFSPAPGEPSHPDFSWYGIHGVETLFTVMGTGCKEVNRMSSEGTDVVVGLWEDGRIGTFRGCRNGRYTYGGTAFCEKKDVAVGGYEGYEVLLTQILAFFKTRVVPVSEKETLEIFTFMEASNESKRQNGKIISMEKTYQKGVKEAKKLLQKKKLL